MKPKPRLSLSLFLCLTSILAPAASAGAATQIGRAYPPSPSGTCFGALIAQAGIQYGSPSYVVPAGGGVITAWGTATATSAGTAKLEVLRPAAIGQYLVVGTDGPRQVAANSSPSFAGIRIPVRAGDVLGMIPFGTNCVARFVGSSFSTTVFGVIDPAPGATIIPIGSAPEYALSVTATLEPDADGDGYGDETQDQCPADPAAQTAPCPAPAAAPAVSGDSTPPLLSLRGRRRQHVSRRQAVIAIARTDESASLRAAATISLPTARRRTLSTVTVTGSPGVGNRLVLKIPRRDRGSLGAALRRGSLVHMLVRVTATDASGNTSRASEVVWLSN